MLRRRWWPRFLLAGALVVVVGATLVSGAAASWTMLAGGVIIVGALWDSLSNSPADYKRERPMPTTPGLVHAVGPVPLSGRERQIVMLAASGMASKDIAQRLYLSVRTVDNHLHHAYTKLGVTSRAGLAQALGSA
jgi:DNA-binding CsgD family transcriptional regulator